MRKAIYERTASVSEEKLLHRKRSVVVGMSYGSAARTTHREARSDAHRAGMGVVFVAAASCLLAASLLLGGIGREPLALLSSGIVQGSSGTEAVLTGRDFVPFGSQGSAKMTATAKRQL
jgi:hypothetical protein